MASIRKRDGKWQAQIRRRGTRPVSKTFTRKTDALTWARQVETEVERGIFLDPTRAEQNPLGDLLTRYTREVVPTIKGAATGTDSTRYYQFH